MDPSEHNDWGQWRNNIIKIALDTSCPVSETNEVFLVYNSLKTSDCIDTNSLDVLELKKCQSNTNKFFVQRRLTVKIIRQVNASTPKTNWQLDENVKKNNSRNIYKIFKRNIFHYTPSSPCWRGQDGRIGHNRDNCYLLAKGDSYSLLFWDFA